MKFSCKNSFSKSADLVTFTEEILIGKLHFLNKKSPLTFTFSKSTIEILGKGVKNRSSVFLIDIEYISFLFLGFLLLTLNKLMLAGKLYLTEIGLS